jgi:hypothetical protein
VPLDLVRPIDQRSIARSVVYTCVMDSKYEELRDTDTDRKTENGTVSYTDCDKEQYISCRASGF